MNHDSNDHATPEKAAQTKVEVHKRAFAPPVDVYESKDELLVVADIPGVTREDMKIDFEDGRLSVFGKRSASDAHDWHRAFAVPQGIDAERISAELAQGVLTVRLPKHEALKPRQIAVRAN